MFPGDRQDDGLVRKGHIVQVGLLDRQCPDGHIDVVFQDLLLQIPAVPLLKA